jgi:two-component system chemotaxis response regulator CheB
MNLQRTLAEDESSAVVFGMPKEAIDIDAAEKVVPLTDIAKTMIMLTQQRAVSARLAQK